MALQYHFEHASQYAKRVLPLQCKQSRSPCILTFAGGSEVEDDELELFDVPMTEVVTINSFMSLIVPKSCVRLFVVLSEQ